MLDFKKMKYKIINQLLHYYNKYIYLSNKQQLKKNYSIKGHISLNQAIELYKIAKSLNNDSVIVEIGSYLGKSTSIIAEGIKDKNNCKLYAIDTFENQGMSEGLRNTFPEFERNTARYKKMITVLKGFSFNVVKDFSESIDFLFIDGNHEYESVKKDIEDWICLVKEGGLVCFDDYYLFRDENRVKKAVNETIEEGHLKPIKVVAGRMMVARKKKHQN